MIGFRSTRPDGFATTARVDRVAAGVGAGRALIGRFVDVILEVAIR